MWKNSCDHRTGGRDNFALGSSLNTRFPVHLCLISITDQSHERHGLNGWETVERQKKPMAQFPGVLFYSSIIRDTLVGDR